MLNYYIIEETLSGDTKLLGSGLEKCLVILNKQDYEDAEEKLAQILNAVGLDKKKDVVICLIDDDNLKNALSIIAKFGIINVLSFGPNISTLYPNIDTPFYQVLRTENYNWLAAPSLVKVLNDPSEKMKLWNALKVMFK